MNILTISSKLTAQMEEMVQASKAMLPEVTLVLKDLANSVSNAVDLAVQVSASVIGRLLTLAQLAQRIGAHVASIRSSKQPLRLADIERFLDEVTADSSAASDAPPWELIGMFISRLSNEIGVALPKIRQAVQAGQVVSSMSTLPLL